MNPTVQIKLNEDELRYLIAAVYKYRPDRKDRFQVMLTKLNAAKSRLDDKMTLEQGVKF